MSTDTCFWLVKFESKITEQCGLPAPFALWYGSVSIDDADVGPEVLARWGWDDIRWFDTEEEAVKIFRLWANKLSRFELEYDRKPFQASYPYQSESAYDQHELAAA